eukprot:scpid99572/ scgid11288/ 
MNEKLSTIKSALGNAASMAINFSRRHQPDWLYEAITSLVHSLNVRHAAYEDWLRHDHQHSTPYHLKFNTSRSYTCAAVDTARRSSGSRPGLRRPLTSIFKMVLWCGSAFTIFTL